MRDDSMRLLPRISTTVSVGTSTSLIALSRGEPATRPCRRLLRPPFTAAARGRGGTGCSFRSWRARRHIGHLFDGFSFRFDHVVAHGNFSKLLRHFCFAIQLAGVPGFEPGLSVLETD